MKKLGNSPRVVQQIPEVGSLDRFPLVLLQRECRVVRRRPPVDGQLSRTTPMLSIDDARRVSRERACAPLNLRPIRQRD
jgi:hypothetical protein